MIDFASDICIITNIKKGANMNNNVYFVTFVANEEFEATVRVKSNSGKKPTKPQASKIVESHIRNDWGQPYSFRIKSIASSKEHFENMPLIGEVGKKDVDKANKTMEVANQVLDNLGDDVQKEVKRLLASGGIDSENHNPNSVIVVAIENVIDKIKNKSCPDYKNLRNF